MPKMTSDKRVSPIQSLHVGKSKKLYSSDFIAVSW